MNPYTDDELEAVKARVEASAGCIYPKTQMLEADLLQAVVDRADLFEETVRLQDENTSLRAQFEDLAARTVAFADDGVEVPPAFYDWLARNLNSATAGLEAELSRLRAENTAQAAKLDAVQALPAIEIGIYWNAQSEAEATGRNATLLEVRRILDGGEPRRADRPQDDVLRDFERDMRTVRALGLDQDGGQA